MKKLLNVLFMFLIFAGFSVTKSFADVPQVLPCKINVILEQDVSTQNPPKTIKAVVDGRYKLVNGQYTNEGTQFTLEVTKVSPEKRGKINAYIEARVTQVYIAKLDKTIEVTNPKAVVKIIPYEKIDKIGKSVDIGISVANHFVSNITYPAHFVKGVAQNKTGNRLQSGAKEVYDSSVLSYTGKGKPLDVKAGESATLSFYMKGVSTDAESTSQTQTETSAEEE